MIFTNPPFFLAMASSPPGCEPAAPETSGPTVLSGNLSGISQWNK
jgi:hypothetical protein